MTLADHIQQWLSGLRPVSHRGICAWVNDSWVLLNDFPEPEKWTAAETELVINLFRPTRVALREFVEEHELVPEEESAFTQSTAVWRDFSSGARPVLAEGPIRPADLFKVGFATDGMVSSVWGWRAIALSLDIALLCEYSDDYGLSMFPTVLGVISRTQPYASAALLFKSIAYKDRERFLDPDNFFGELTASKISAVEVYRLLLARSGHGGTKILTASRRELVAFRTRAMKCGFSEVRELLA